MKITGSIKNNILILYLSGELDHHSAASTREAMENMQQKYRFHKLILDLSEMTFIDSSGIGVFYGRLNAIKSVGGRAALVGLNDKISRFIHISGLDKCFEVYPDEQSAVDVFTQEQ